MITTLRRRALLLLTLLLSFAMAFTPAAGLAQTAQNSIEELGASLLQAQLDYDEANAAYDKLAETVIDLQAQYDKGTEKQKLAVQDKLIEALIEEETLSETLQEAEKTLTDLQAKQQKMLKDAECEALTAEYDGKYADLTLEVWLDENMTVYALTVEVDGSERDQAAGENAFLYQFIGKTLPVTIGNAKDDDVREASGAAQTSKDVVKALNSLVYEEEEPSGPIIEPQAIADYIFKHGKLPDNFITKKEAQKLGWDSSYNYVSDVAPGKSIGGDRFGNYEGLLPSKKGRQWYEADCYYTKGKRNAHRILYSNDGLVYYTDDHYETFTQMFPSK